MKSGYKEPKKAMPPKGHSRFPNGFGSIVKLSGNRRRPFMARKTVGFDDKGHPIYKIIGYAETWYEALDLLMEYNKNPYDIDAKSLTFADVFEKWRDRKFNEIANGHEISETTKRSYMAAYKHCVALYDLKFADLTAIQLQQCMDNCDRSRETVERIKILYSQMYKYAMEFDIVLKDYSKFVVIRQAEKKSDKKIMSDEEVREIWEHDGELAADCALILLYTGMRIKELEILQKENIYMEEGYMRTGVKTSAGKDRVIPIHEKIYHIIERYIDLPGKRLINLSDRRIRECFVNFLADLGMDYRPHECRHTFISKADSVKMNEVALKNIVGHSQGDITKGVYTHKTIPELIYEINKICY